MTARQHIRNAIVCAIWIALAYVAAELAFNPPYWS